jgi:hypothetical protein
MKAVKRLIPILVNLLLIAGSARSIVVQDYGVATNPPTGSWNLNWDNVYNYKKSSAVAVARRWVLTAAHVADDINSSIPNFSNIVVNGTVYYPQEIILHVAKDDSEHSNNTDLALVRFDKPFPGYYSLYTGTFPTYSGHGLDSRLKVVMVGFGVTGTVSSTYFTPSPYYNPSSGIKRWGSQKIEGGMIFSYDSFGPAGYFTNAVGFKMDFNTLSGGTDYEAGFGTYDSGGGTFVEDGGMWKLAGINTLIYAASSGTPSGSDDRILAISVPSYYSWITNTIAQADGDANTNGIPNYWEKQYSGTTTGLTASADSDSDGFSNLREYYADTNPTNPASFFEVTEFTVSSNQLVRFNGSTARQYQLFYTTNDLASTNLTWITVNTNKIWGAGTNTSITATNADSKAFYRLKVTLP